MTKASARLITTILLILLTACSQVGDEEAQLAALLDEAEELRQQGALDEAQRRLNEAIVLNEENVLPLVKRALLRVQMRDFEGAREDVREVFRQRPDLLAAYYADGLVRFYTGDFEGAASSLGRASTDPGQFPQSLLLLGAAQYQSGDSVAAEQSVSAYVERFPGNPSAQRLLAVLKLNNGDYEAARELLERGGDKEAGGDMDGVNLPDADILIALQYLKDGDTDAALSLVEKYLVEVPDSVVGLNLLGKIQLAQGATDTARDAWQKVLELAPGNVAANHALAEMEIEAERFEAARSHYEQVLQARGEFVPTLVLLAKLEIRQGDIAATEEALLRAHRAGPDAPEPKILLARLYIASGRLNDFIPLFKNLAEVRNYLPTILETAEPSHRIAARIAVARALLQDMQLEPAAEQVTILASQAPADPNVLMLEGALARRQGKPALALANYREAFQILPSTSNRLVLASQLGAMGDLQESLELLAEGVDETPGDIEVRLAYATALAGSGEREAALQQYREVLELAPDNLVALNNMAWYLRDHKPEEALEFAKKAAALAPGNAEIQDTLAVLLMQRGELSQALAAIEQIPAIEQANPVIRYHHAVILAELGESARAAESLRVLLDSEESFEEREAAQSLLESLQAGG